jgi:hypothetical protein
MPQAAVMQHRPHPAQRAVFAQALRVWNKTAETLRQHEVSDSAVKVQYVRYDGCTDG